MPRRRYTPETDPREKIKDYFRKFIAFMCSQVGVGALVVCYTLIGAVGFSRLESTFNDTSVTKVDLIRGNYTRLLWLVAHKTNVFNKTEFFIATNEKLKCFQNEMVVVIKKGYNGHEMGKMWTFPAALMFALSVITMIGYGNLVPRTGWGKFATVVYAVFGIPLFVLYFLNVGEILAGCFKWIYTKLYECSTRRGEKVHKRIVVPTTACLWVMGGYILTGAIMFAEWEHWTYLDSAYFCVTSLCKLGLGDFVPGTASQNGNESKLVINFIYILVGMGLVAMCFNLMREEVRVKVEEFREDFRQCLEDTRVRIEECCRKYRHRDQF
ncbi:potassium channel subfamily K member 9 isoform X1 [Tribolium madens]|uniref:potassium channel subfamily K member 9 isoform X1 n=1 Tax=Tribolium madens TaxID=41895 RepID=UPI001CF75EE5|nr:potassium channel subfamily K member 9 isoform X1 [Tribolium madens]